MTEKAALWFADKALWLIVALLTIIMGWYAYEVRCHEIRITEGEKKICIIETKLDYIADGIDDLRGKEHGK